MTAITVACPDGAALSVWMEGAGPDLLLVSGLGGSAGFWSPLVSEWAARFRVIRLDQRGIGASTRGTASCTIDQLADDCLHCLDAVGSRAAIMIGHSTGGCILQSLVLRAPERVTGLVLSGAWARPSRYLRELFAARLRLLELSPREYTAVAAFLSYPPAWIEENWSEVEAGLARAPDSAEARQVVRERITALTSFDRSAEIAGITQPILVAGAEDDAIVPAFMQRDLAERLPGSTLQMLASGGHFFPITRRQAFMEALESWLAERVR